MPSTFRLSGFAIALVTVIEAIIGLASGWISTLLTKDVATQLLIGLAGFLAAGIVTFKVMFVLTDQKLADLSIQSEMAKLGFEPQMLDKPEQQPLRDLLHSIADYWRRKGELSQCLRTLLDESLNHFRKSLETLPYGEVYFTWQDIRNFACTVLSEAKKDDKILSTSLVSTPYWWLDSEGRPHEYLIKKRDAVTSGAEVTQIFITPSKEALRSDENIIKELIKPTQGKSIQVYAISENVLPNDERRDVLLLKRSTDSVGFELDLRNKTWIEGFRIYAEDKTRQLEELFSKLQARSQLIKYDMSTHRNYEDFVEEVFK